MPLSSYSDSDTDKHEGLQIFSSGTPVCWNRDDWTFFKHAMINAFESSLLDQIATGMEALDLTPNDERERHKNVVRARIDI
ncbi:unnamed protein product [Peronospora farinosa]|uniref:Uncharacterized protein n=1 Tax=Peronospora farinosa TaxID=134698 RepID=A0ABN8CFB1_9STRA|nr:unnamed protein product [Peronospora farinosa]